MKLAVAVCGWISRLRCRSPGRRLCRHLTDERAGGDVKSRETPYVLASGTGPDDGAGSDHPDVREIARHKAGPHRIDWPMGQGIA